MKSRRVMSVILTVVGYQGSRGHKPRNKWRCVAVAEVVGVTRAGGVETDTEEQEANECTGNEEEQS